MINGNKIKNTGSMRLLHTQTQHKYAFDFALVYKISNKMCARQVNCHGRLTEIRFLRLMRIVMLLAGLPTKAAVFN